MCHLHVLVDFRYKFGSFVKKLESYHITVDGILVQIRLLSLPRIVYALKKNNMHRNTNQQKKVYIHLIIEKKPNNYTDENNINIQ